MVRNDEPITQLSQGPVVAGLAWSVPSPIPASSAALGRHRSDSYPSKSLRGKKHLTLVSTELKLPGQSSSPSEGGNRVQPPGRSRVLTVGEEFEPR